jgi:hypothetical protein
MKILSVLIGLTALALFACSSETEKTGGGDGPAYFFSTEVEPVPLADSGVTVAGVEFRPPIDWTNLGPSGMRLAEYMYGPCENNPDSATLAVYYFGPEQGGGVRANIDRWIGQMVQPDGSDPQKAAREQKVVVDDMPVHVVEVTGTYTSGGMGMGQNISKKDYRMTALVLEAPEGNVFFKLTGPDICAAEMTKELSAMVMAIKKAD